MNRRGFMKAIVGGVVIAAAVRTFPFRVFSFPSEIVAPPFKMMGISVLEPARGPWERMMLTSELPMPTFTWKWTDETTAQLLTEDWRVQLPRRVI